ncbi:MAG: Holliday junction resolvase Hjc [Nanoarchaeota archaeon]
MVKSKAKGIQGERELVIAFNEAGWSCVRIAGSGSSHYPAPDILAGNAQRRVAIECKVTKDHKKYFPDEEVEQLKAFSQKFGAESWIGLRFPRQPWYFVLLEDLEKTGNLWAISQEAAQRKGLKMEELTEKV